MKQNITFSYIPTTCFRTERPAFFHKGAAPKDTDVQIEKFIRKIKEVIARDEFTFVVGGKAYMAHPKWIRDHIHEMKAFKHWEYDLREYLEFMAEHQDKEGFFYEMVQPDTDYHSHLMPEKFMKHIDGEELTMVRIEAEADIEYLMVEGAVAAYQATGDNEWMKKMLPALEKGINYLTSHPTRWDTEHGLVKRPFTIDTWDFMDTEKDIRWIDEHTPMSVMHGDNTGVYEAMKSLAWINRRFGKMEKAKEWEERADILLENLNKYCWNGTFYTHQLHLNHNGKDEKENERLSLSNTYDMNRGATTIEQAQSIIREYKRRRDAGHTFAEWFTIDPPYESFRPIYKAGEYINGTVCSIVAGELARAALQNGEEEYGWDILKRLMSLQEKDGELYFMYNPKTGENAGGGPSGWGCASVLTAIEEGLAGIIDKGVCYDALYFSPKWVITEYESIKYMTGYRVSHTLVETYYEKRENGMYYSLRCPSKTIQCHVLLPQSCQVSEVTVNQQSIEHAISWVGESTYVDFNIERNACESDTIEIQINLL